MNAVFEPTQQQLLALLDNSVCSVLIADGDGRIVFHSAAAEPMFGYSSGELTSCSIRQLIPDETGLDAGETPKDLPDNLILAFSGLTLEVLARRNDGKRFPAEVSISQLPAADPPLFATIVRDVTSRSRTQWERDHLSGLLERAQKLESVGLLAAGVAHEINTPAQFIGDNLQFLREACRDLFSALGGVTALCHGIGPDADVAAELGKIERDSDLEYLQLEVPRALDQAIEGIDQIAEIVAALKAFCHPGSKVRQPTDLNSVLQNTVNLSRSEWKYVAEVTTDLDPQLPVLVCDDNQLCQVFLNILVNAAHALSDSKVDDESRGRIDVRTKQRDGWIVVTIADNGPGIPSEHLDRLFDPFFTTKEQGRGTGQGLAIAHAIVVEGHRGRIEVDTRPGHGTAFHVSLPLEEAEA